MSDLFSVYRPPAVYFDEVPSIAPSIVGISPALVAIVGPSLGYRTYTDGPFAITSTNHRLNKLGIDTTSVTVRKVGQTVDVASSEYTKTSGTGTNATLDIKVSSGATGGTAGLVANDQVVVTYHYTDVDFYNPVLVQSYSAAVDYFGEDFDAAGAIQSPLTLAARLAFNNGANQVLLAAIPKATTIATADLVAAYDRLTGGWDNVDLVVPLPVGISGTPGSPGSTGTVAADLAAFMNHSEAEGIYRIGVLGYESTMTTDPSTIARATANQRVVETWPTAMTYYNGLTAQSVVISGYYLAAAVAGRLSALSPSESLTRKSIVGFSNISDLALRGMSRSNKDAWSAAGVLVVENTTTRGSVVRHGVTTDTSSINSREINVVRAKDTMVQLLRDQLDSASIIGSPIVAETGANLKSIVTGALERLVDGDVIVGYQALEVRQLVSDPTVMQIKFAYLPVYPLNYVLITFAVDTTTGKIASTIGLNT